MLLQQGGTASNLVTLIAKADVALSVTMTAFSTLAASYMTPFLTSKVDKKYDFLLLVSYYYYFYLSYYEILHFRFHGFVY